MLDDTIAAISTPPGEGGIGIVRLSGPDAIEVVDRLFVCPGGAPLADAASHTVNYGHIAVDGRRLDEVLVSVMRAPRTYTRENVVEINCHGGIVATRAVLDAALAGGARLAERGEFTKRAFLNGRISLDQAQAVLDAVRAKTTLGLEAAVDRLGGRFSVVIAEIRAHIAEFIADLDVEIDFPDLDIESDALLLRLRDLAQTVADLIEKAEQGRVVRDGLSVAIIGRPNVGKSTLLNALLAEDRAIVTPIPGTTRDTVEEEAAIGGVPIRLIDTAGLRAPTDPVEAEGVRRTQEAVDRADLLLLLLDRSQDLTDEDRELLAREWACPMVLVLSKSDLPAQLGDLPAGTWKEVVEVSAQESWNLEGLRGAILDLFLAGGVPSRGSILLLDTWERDLLRRVQGFLGGAERALASGATPDIVSEELRHAYRTAGELQGIDVSESILDVVFSRFCVGK